MTIKQTYVCSKGHLVKAENSVVSIDSLCSQCKRIQHYRQNRALQRLREFVSFKK